MSAEIRQSWIDNRRNKSAVRAISNFDLADLPSVTWEMVFVREQNWEHRTKGRNVRRFDSASLQTALGAAEQTVDAFQKRLEDTMSLLKGRDFKVQVDLGKKFENDRRNRVDGATRVIKKIEVAAKPHLTRAEQTFRDARAELKRLKGHKADIDVNKLKDLEDILEQTQIIVNRQISCLETTRKSIEDRAQNIRREAWTAMTEIVKKKSETTVFEKKWTGLWNSKHQATFTIKRLKKKMRTEGVNFWKELNEKLNDLDTAYAEFTTADENLKQKFKIVDKYPSKLFEEWKARGGATVELEVTLSKLKFFQQLQRDVETAYKKSERATTNMETKVKAVQSEFERGFKA